MAAGSGSRSAPGAASRGIVASILIARGPRISSLIADLGRDQMALLQNTRSDRTLLVEPELLIGRSPSAGLCITEPYVSAQHALLRWAGAHWVLKDLGSRNGTFLNGVRLQGGRN